MQNYKIYVFIIPILVLCLPLKQTYMQGKCVKVIDGDTIIIERGRKREKIRLGFIDAPELNQASVYLGIKIGLEAKEFLEKKILGKIIDVDLYGRGKYGRWIGEVKHAGENINLSLVLNGHAILYKYEPYPSNHHRAHFHQSQNIAKNNRRGVWRTYAFQNPSYYRKSKRSK